MNDLRQLLPEIEILKNDALSQYTYTKTGGNADFVAFPKNVEEVQQLVDEVNRLEIPLTVIGNASNLIVKDGGIRGLVIILTQMASIKVEKHRVIAQAGATLIKTTYAALEASLKGMEFASGIPGSVGGAIFMNAGAYDGEISDIVEEVTVLTRAGRVKKLNLKELEFSYRHCVVQESGDVVLSATFHLKRGNHEVIKKQMDELTALRASKQPLEYPSCGSVFKRPAGHFTGKLIQEAGLQGLKWGGAQISEKHAGFIVNIDHATATDYLELIQHIQKTIKTQFNVELQTEVQIIGEETK